VAYAAEITALGCELLDLQGGKRRLAGTIRTAEAVEMWAVPTPMLERFLGVIYGTPEEILPGVFRTVPLRCSRFPKLIMEDYDGEEVGAPDDTGECPEWHFRIRFTMPTYDGTMVSVNYAADERLMKYPAASAGGEPVYHAKGQAVVITLHNLSTLPFNTWATYGGYLNQNTWRGVAPGYAMFEPPDASEEVLYSGERRGEATTTVRVNRIHWNDEWAPNQTLVRVGAHPSVDFASVLGI
jgi:hypothetical protein